MKEYRSADVASNEGNILEGTPIVFNRRALIHDISGDYYEVILPSALDGCNLNDSSLRIEHDTTSIPLARSPKTMTLTVTADGLHMRALLAGTEHAREAYEAVKRGDIRGMSFAFTVAEGGSSYDPSTNTRTISRIAKIYEISLCANPAYTETSVEARSQIQDGRRREEERRQLVQLANEIILF